MFLVAMPADLSWFLVFFALAGIVWIGALVSVTTSEFKDSITKLIWVLIILLGSIIGALLYFAIGRSQALYKRAFSAKYIMGIGAAVIIIALGIFGAIQIPSYLRHAEIERRSKADIAASHAYFDSVRKAQDTVIARIQ